MPEKTKRCFLPLGMADTKRFFHQGLLRSDFSSSLSFLSSTYGQNHQDKFSYKQVDHYTCQLELNARPRLFTSPFRESLLGDDDGPKAKAPAGSRSSATTRRLRPGSLVGRRPGHTMSELRLRTSLSGKEWRCLVCSSSAWARQWGVKREWRVSCPRALASGMGGSGGGWVGLV